MSAALLGPTAAQTPSSAHSLVRVPNLTKAEQARLQTVKRRALDAVGPAVVHVMVMVGGILRMQRDSTGVVVTPDGLVLTNWRLIREMSPRNGKKSRRSYSLQVRTDKGEEHPASILAVNPDYDLALLRIQRSDRAKMPYAKLGDSHKILAGETLLVCSRPNEKIYANFIGGASDSQGDIKIGEQRIAKDDILLSDVNMRVFSDGAPVFDIAGRLLAIVNSGKVRAPLGKDATEADKLEHEKGYGFSMRVHVAQRLFPQHLGKLKPTSIQSPSVVKERGLLSTGVARVKDAIVSVRRARVTKMPRPSLVDPYGKFAQDPCGSGVLVHRKGIVLTNSHLVGEGPVLVTLLNGKTYKGSVVANLSDKNIAVVKLKVPTSTRLPSVELARSSAGILGEPVAAVGNRYGHTLGVKIGVLSSRERSGGIGKQHKRSMGHLQTEANIYPGNTGGALINIHGRLVGINDLKAAVDRADLESAAARAAEKKDMTIGFAVPIGWIVNELRTRQPTIAKDLKVPDKHATAISYKDRETVVSKIVAAHANCFLNVFVKTEKLQKKKTGLLAELFPEPANDEDFRLLGQGSGVIIDPSGLALTNWHVVDAAVYRDGSTRKDHKVFVSLSNGKRYEVEVLSTSRNDDLALLQIKNPEQDPLQAIRLGDSDALKVGDTAIAVGNPHGFASSVTVGLVSAKNRDILIKGHAFMARGMIQTDAAINPGTSGGALIDLNGYLIGINSAGNSMEAKVGFAIPVNKVRQRFNDTLLASEKLRSVYLGMALDINEAGKVFVKKVHEFGPAVDAKIRVGDTVIKAKGQPIHNKLEFIKLTRAAVPGRPFPVVVSREGKTRKFVLIPVSEAAWFVFRYAGFAVREVNQASHAKQLQQAGSASYRELTGNKDAGSDTMKSGLVVTHVHPEAIAAGMDIKLGDIVVGLKMRVVDIQHEHGRSYLEQITGLKEMQDFIRRQSTVKGRQIELWVARQDQVIKAQVLAKKPAK
ncbi:MAG: trypsin-like peptidase domain-containing protein [Planctomycetota bacterium]|nr:trypsin-like peptidase domain-containing protein [Planctomycetota bacterium]